MKTKTLALGAVSAAVLALCASDASAFWLGRWCNGCNRYQSVIVCRPYNAFTPICYGNITCDGCCPSPCCAPLSLPSLQPWCTPCGSACGSPCGSPCGDPCGGAYAAPAPTIVPAPGMPLPPGAMTMAGRAPGVYPVSYQPYAQPYGYYPMPGYYPMNYGYNPAAYYTPAAYPTPMSYYGAPGYGAPSCGYPGCTH